MPLVPNYLPLPPSSPQITVDHQDVLHCPLSAAAVASCRPPICGAFSESSARRRRHSTSRTATASCRPITGALSKICWAHRPLLATTLPIHRGRLSFALPPSNAVYHLALLLLLFLCLTVAAVDGSLQLTQVWQTDANQPQTAVAAVTASSKSGKSPHRYRRANENPTRQRQFSLPFLLCRAREHIETRAKRTNEVIERRQEEEASRVLGRLLLFLSITIATDSPLTPPVCIIIRQNRCQAALGHSATSILCTHKLLHCARYWKLFC